MSSWDQGQEYDCLKYFLSFPQKNCNQRKLRQTKYVFTVAPKKPFDTWQFGKIGVWVNFIAQNLKSEHLVCLSFLW